MLSFPNIKGSSTNFTHLVQFPEVEEDYRMCVKCINLQWELCEIGYIASSDVTWSCQFGLKTTCFKKKKTLGYGFKRSEVTRLL